MCEKLIYYLMINLQLRRQVLTQVLLISEYWAQQIDDAKYLYMTINTGEQDAGAVSEKRVTKYDPIVQQQCVGSL